MNDELILAKLDAINAKLDLLLARGVHVAHEVPQARPSVPPKVAGALSLYCGALPREVQMGVRRSALARLALGSSEDEVIRAIQSGEGSEHPKAQGIMASV